VNDFTGWSKALTVTADGDAVISHAGAAALRLAAGRRRSARRPLSERVPDWNYGMA
jgi:hypothetical protein